MAFDRFENAYFRLVSGGTFSYSWHISFPLNKFLLAFCCAAADYSAEKQSFFVVISVLLI